MHLDPTERRVLGALIEKRFTTPDVYPLTLNALVAACNQKSNRDPVMALEDFEISGCLLGLRQRQLLMQHESYGGRVPHYSERFLDEMALTREEGAVLAELMLRGDQTATELQRRCARMADFKHPETASNLLRELARKGLVELQPRASGQRHARWRHLLAPEGEARPAARMDDEEPDDLPPPTRAPAAPPSGPAAPPGELAQLREEIAELRRRVESLEDQITRP